MLENLPLSSPTHSMSMKSISMRTTKSIECPINLTGDAGPLARACGKPGSRPRLETFPMASHTNEAYGRLRYLLLRYPRASVNGSFIRDDKIFISLTIHMDGHLPLQRMELDLLLLRARPGHQCAHGLPQSDPEDASRAEWERLAALLPNWELLESEFVSP